MKKFRWEGRKILNDKSLEKKNRRRNREKKINHQTSNRTLLRRDAGVAGVDGVDLSIPRFSISSPDSDSCCCFDCL